MKGLVLLGNSKAELRDLPVPEPRPGWVRIKLRAAGICGSDLHFYHDTPANLGSRVGMVVGHEPSGTVDALGEGVTQVAIGDRVSVFHWLGCGHCSACLKGYRQMCPEGVGIAASGNGSTAEYLTAPAVNCLPLPRALSYGDGACMACCAATAYSSLRKLQARGGTTLVVFGLGPVGLCIVLEAVAMGARVIGVDLVPERMQLAMELGANAVIHAGGADVVSQIEELTEGHGADLAAETSGSVKGRAAALEAVCAWGRVAYIGLGANLPAIDPASMIYGEKTLMGSYVMPMGMYDEFARFLIERQVHVDRIITHRFSIERAVEAIELFDSRTTGKVLIEFMD